MPHCPTMGIQAPSPSLPPAPDSRQAKKTLSTSIIIRKRKDVEVLSFSPKRRCRVSSCAVLHWVSQTLLKTWRLLGSRNVFVERRPTHRRLPPVPSCLVLTWRTCEYRTISRRFLTTKGTRETRESNTYRPILAARRRPSSAFSPYDPDTEQNETTKKRQGYNNVYPPNPGLLRTVRQSCLSTEMP